jgi:UDP:flavonoid glycosyltransferase YjiC (YdhE family)
LDAWLTDGPPVVYGNLGTLAVPSDALLAALSAALTSSTFRSLWILQPGQAARLARAPSSGMRILPWGPTPAAILRHPNVRVFVSHCGINSTYESLWAGTPIVGVPMFADQLDMAVRVADAGVGVWCDRRRLDADELRRAIHRVLSEDSFRSRISAVQEAIANSGGARRAADLIERHGATATPAH